MLSRDGFRVLALAYRDFEPRHAYSKDDESDLILAGYVAFLDPPKETAMAAIEPPRAGVAVGSDGRQRPRQPQDPVRSSDAD